MGAYSRYLWRPGCAGNDSSKESSLQYGKRGSSMSEPLRELVRLRVAKPVGHTSRPPRAA